MKKKNKGFTLIELLAVIVILGIILTIVVSNVVKYIGKAREGAFKDTYAKVLKDVSNKIALNDLGGDTEEVECKNPTECADAYDVPAENIALSVYSMGDDEYGVRMTGKGNYASISLSSTNCTNNAKCNAQSMSSTVNSDGEVSPSEISIKKDSDFDKVINGTEQGVKEIETVKISNTLSYIKYKKTNEDEERKFYNSEGKELKGLMLKDGKSIDEFFAYYNFFEKLINNATEDTFSNYFDDKYKEITSDTDKFYLGEGVSMKPYKIYKVTNANVDYMICGELYYFSASEFIMSNNNNTLAILDASKFTYKQSRSNNRGNFLYDKRK